MPTVRVSTPLHPSEDPARVAAAASAFFPDAQTTVSSSDVVVEASSLEAFGHALARQRIIEAARHELLHGLDASRQRAVFRINKQAAAVGRVSFAVDDAPLGVIEIYVSGADTEAALKAAAPPTHKGFPISEEEADKRAERARVLRDARRAQRGAAVPVDPIPEDEHEDWT